MRVLAAQAREPTHLANVGNVRAVIEHVDDSCRDQRIGKFPSRVFFKNSGRTKWRLHWHKAFPQRKGNNNGETNTEQDHDTRARSGYKVCVYDTCKDQYATDSKQYRSYIVQNFKCPMPGDSTGMFRWKIEPI